jgi:hypothetical protein
MPMLMPSPARIACPIRKTMNVAGRLIANAVAQHRQPPRDGGHRRADHPGRVLAGDRQDAEHAEGELGEVDPGEADRERVEFGAIVGTEMGPARLEDDAGEDADADREQQGRRERVAGGAQ